MCDTRLIWSRIIFAALICSVVGSCAVYDRDAWPAAESVDNAGYASCNTLVGQHGIKTYAEMIECYLKADEVFVGAINLQRRDLFHFYAANMRQLGANADAGRVPRAEVGSRIAVIQASFREAINQADVDTRAAQRELVGGVAAFGQGYAAGMAARGQTQPQSAATMSYNPQPQLAPNGTYVSGRGAPTLCPNGTYVAGACHLTPAGTYVGD